MNLIFFDTETTGTHATARITQIAWQLYTDALLVNEYATLIRPDGWTVPTEDFFIRNNMSTERCEVEGRAMREVLREFIADYERADAVVAHNADFDRRMINYEMQQYSAFPTTGKPYICTMKASIKFCALPGRFGDYKWPRLEELYAKLFDQPMQNAHDALADIRATSRCFFELQQRGIITI